MKWVFAFLIVIALIDTARAGGTARFAGIDQFGQACTLTFSGSLDGEDMESVRFETTGFAYTISTGADFRVPSLGRISYDTRLATTAIHPGLIELADRGGSRKDLRTNLEIDFASSAPSSLVLTKTIKGEKRTEHCNHLVRADRVDSSPTHAAR